MNELKDVFICHASEDKLEIIKPLVDALKEKAFHTGMMKQRLNGEIV